MILLCYTSPLCQCGAEQYQTFFFIFAICDLLSAALTCEAGAAVTVRTYWAWETTTTLRLLGGARGAWAPMGGGELRGHIVSPRAQHVIVNITTIYVCCFTSVVQNKSTTTHSTRYVLQRKGPSFICIPNFKRIDLSVQKL